MILRPDQGITCRVARRGESYARAPWNTPPDDIRQHATGRPATQPPDSDDKRQHRRRPRDDMRQQANGRPCSSGRGAAKFTPIYSYLCLFCGVFTGYLLGYTVFAAYFGVLLPKFGRFLARFWSANARNSRDLSTHTQLCDICQQTNGRPCGNVLKSFAGAGVPREFYSQTSFIPVACDRSRGKYLPGYIVVRASSRAGWGVRILYGNVRFLYGFCTVFMEKRTDT